MNRTVFFINVSFCDTKKKITQKIFSSDESDSEIEIQFNHDTSYEEDKQEETDGKSDDSGKIHCKKTDDEQVNNNLKKEIMLKLLKDNMLGITQLLLEKAMVMKLK